MTEKENESAMCDSRASEAILVVVGIKLQFWQEICEQLARPYILTKAGIFDTGFGEILRSPLLQGAEKLKFQPDSRKPGVTDPSLNQHIARVGIEVFELI